jgi:adenylate cyclase
MRHLEYVTLDLRTRWRASLQPDYVPETVVVGIDDESIEKGGRWPWKRAVHGELIALVAQARASVIAWDILFLEPDKIEPLNDERLLAGAVTSMKAGTDVIFGGMTNETPGVEVLQPLTSPVGLIEGDVSKLLGEKAWLPPIPDLQEAAYYGAVDAPPDEDGARRRVPLIVRGGERFFFSLSLQTVLRHWKVPSERVRVRLGDGIYIPAPDGDRRIPIDAEGHYLVNYRYGVPQAPYFLGFSSFSSGLARAHVRRERVAGLPDVKGKVLLVGLAASGLTDSGFTPFSGSSPLVLVHANVIDNILRGDFVRVVPAKWVWLGGVSVTIAALWLFSRRSLREEWVFACAVPVLYVAAGTLAWLSNFWLPLVWPLLGFGLIQVFSIGSRLLAAQRAKAEIKAMFGAYVSPELVKRMVDSGQKPQLGGHEENVTAYFSDIQGFSAFSELLPAARLVELMNEYLTVCTDIVQSEGGTLDKYIGDAVVAIFGAPLPLKDHAYRACLVAQRVQRALGELRGKWQAEGDKWPDIVGKMQSRIGLNSGPCVIGNMGSRTRFNYTMMGDNVNLAARMESGAKAWGVYSMCTDATKRACEEHGGDRVIFRSLGRIVVMGRSRPVPIYEIAGLKEWVTADTRECVRLFEDALQKYYARDWSGALNGFERSLQYEPNQPGKTPGAQANPSLVYLGITRKYLAEPPPADWAGVYVMKEK